MTFSTLSSKKRNMFNAFVRSDGTGVHKDGTGVHKDGTGVHKDGTGVHKDGTGISKFLSVMIFALSLLSSTSLIAAEFSADDMNIQVRNNNVFVTLIRDGEMFVGRSAAQGPYSFVLLTQVSFESPIFDLNVAGSGTGVDAAGSGTGINAAGSGTGLKAAGSGTGALAAGSGTGALAAGSGTGALAAGSGTGALAAGSGTGALAAGSGTGSHAAGSGTGGNAAGSGTGGNAAGSGTGGDAAGSGTGNDGAGSGTGHHADGRAAFAVDVALGCDGIEAILYEVVSLAEVGHYTTGMPAMDASQCGGDYAYTDSPNLIAGDSQY